MPRTLSLRRAELVRHGDPVERIHYNWDPIESGGSSTG